MRRGDVLGSQHDLDLRANARFTAALDDLRGGDAGKYGVLDAQGQRLLQHNRQVAGSAGGGIVARI